MVSFQHRANHIPPNASHLQLSLLRPTKALIKQGWSPRDWNSRCIPRSVSGLLCLPVAHPQTILGQSLALPASVGPAPSNAGACVNNWSAPGVWTVADAGCPLRGGGGGHGPTFGVFRLPSSGRAACSPAGLVAHLGPQAPAPSHVHSGGFGHGGRRRGGRQDQDLQSPHDPGVWGSDPAWG